MEDYSGFVNIYSIQKTLRFELKPVGKTLEHIEKKGFLKKDKIRAEDYKAVKKIIDKYHRAYIEEVFDSVLHQKKKKDKTRFSTQFIKEIKEFSELYYKTEKNIPDKERLEALSEKLRKMLVGAFKGEFSEEVAEKYKNLFSKELIRNEIEKFCETDEERKQVSNFKSFTTYFTGFHSNRQNIYSDEKKSTAIGYRIIHQNLPKFLDNLKIIESIQRRFKDFPWSDLKKNLKKIDKNIKLTEYFSIDGFVNVLNQKGIDAYNTILGGKSEESGEKIQGLNEYINLYRQKNNIDRKNLPNVKILFKQILGDRETKSFIPEAFPDDQSVLNSITEFAKYLKLDKKKKSIIAELKKFLSSFNRYELDGIYLANDNSLASISTFLFDDWSFIKKSVSFKYDESVGDPKKKIKSPLKYEKEKEKWLKQKYYTISFLNDAIESYSKSQDEKRVKIRLEAYFAEFKSKDDAKKQFDLLERIEEAYAIVEPLLGAEYPRDRNLKADKKEVGKIKDFLDSIKSLQFFLKPLLSAEIFDEKDLGFYNQLEGYYEEIDSIGHLYNKVRNYLTGKIYSKEKFKLNFENSTLLKGWDENREVANLCVIFREDQKYYLGVMDKENNTILSDIPKVKPNELFYEKMVYKLIPTPHMQLPRIIFSSDNLSIYNPSKSILKIREAKSFKEGKNFKLKDCHKFIDFYKESISKNEDWSRFDFKFSKTSSYENISEFYREVERQGYNLDFKKVSKFYIDSLVEDGKLYLFQIYNKDFSIFSKGKPNLHTIYFRSLFSKENLKDVCLKLNGEAEMFFRKKSINYDEKKKREGHHPELFEKLKYPILKDKRYSEDKFQFHLPISLNFKSKERLNFNLKVNEFLKRNKDINIIGIDRGERNLLYLVMINQKGEILKQTLLDSMQSGKGRPEINYKEKLQEKEIERDKARKSWGTVENIKELKEGYLSIVIHQISKLMVENNAIVVLEDLNIGFKRGRQKVERQVYQKFEKMLIDKLNFLVFKENKPTEPGGVLKAYQLTDEFQSFEKLSKQTGFLFYVPSWNTSKIDPRTGFIDFLHPAYENIEKAKQWINKFDSIRFNSKMDWFEFTADTRKFSENLMLGKNRVWVICTTNVERYFTSKTANSSIQYNSIQITEKLKELFVDIPFSNGQDLKPEILRKNDAVFFKSLLFYIKTTLSLRQNNGKKGEEEKDFILSPVVDSKGRFFNSLEASDDEPKDADANGAYHIALKGLMNLLVLNETKEENLSRPKWKIKNKDWLEFVWERNR